MKLDAQTKKFNIALFMGSALISGFILIPLHELGHVICHWLSGNPAGMSYARDYMLNDGVYTLIGVSGGLILPLLVSVTFTVIMAVKKSHFELLSPLAILGAAERSIQYLFGTTPSDEKIVSEMISIDVNLVKLAFILFPVILIGILVALYLKNGFKIPKILAVIAVTILSYFAMAAFGIFVVERLVFPVQYHLQFG